MLRIIAHAALLAGALALGACGVADSRAPVPEFMRMKETEQPPPEAPPDVKRLVREQIDDVFLATSYPREVHVASPHREVRGPGWTACVRAQLTSATGTSLAAGELEAGQSLRAVAETDGLVVFGDGIESDRLTLSWGQEVELRLADRTLHVVH